MTESGLERHMAMLIRAAGQDYPHIPPPEREYRFAPPRRWRFDFAFPDLRLAIEVEGGTWVSGRHNRGAGFERDCEKYNTAVTLGWRVLRFTRGMIDDGLALEQLQEFFGNLRPYANVPCEISEESAEKALAAR